MSTVLLPLRVKCLERSYTKSLTAPPVWTISLQNTSETFMAKYFNGINLVKKRLGSTLLVAATYPSIRPALLDDVRHRLHEGKSPLLRRLLRFILFPPEA